MRDGKEGIKKAITDYEESEQYIRKDTTWKLTEEEKELIEYGYVQCMLQVASDIGNKSESFITGLQEIVLGNRTVMVAVWILSSAVIARTR